MSNDFAIASALAACSPRFRQPDATEPLSGGQSTVRLVRLRYAWGEAVLKGPLQPREASFYRDVAPHLAAEGIAVPTVYEHIALGDDQWVLREAFPDLLPMGRWVGDAAVMATLRQLHALPLSFGIPQPYVPAWQPLAEGYRAALPAATLAMIDRLGAQHAELFMPICVTAGDPNTTNWGIRADGTVVLFDWDRVGYGIPAHDVVTVYPQFGWPTLYQQVATAYLGNDDAAAVAHFAHDMAIARVQIMIDYINTPAILEPSRHYVLALLPSWVAMIAQMDAEHHQRYG